MINIIWFLLIFIGIIFSMFSNNGDISSIILNSSNDAFELIKSILPLVVLWSGIMNIAKESGLLRKFSNLLYPLLKRLFPSVKNKESLDYISSNIAANMLGLGSVATPAGLKAMEELNKENNDSDKASDAMITFLVLNTSGVVLIPMSVIAMRMSYGSVSPTKIIVPSIIATCFSSLCGLLLDYFIRRKHANK